MRSVEIRRESRSDSIKSEEADAAGASEEAVELMARAYLGKRANPSPSPPDRRETQSTV